MTLLVAHAAVALIISLVTHMIGLRNHCDWIICEHQTAVNKSHAEC
jgi:hypothetical protein